MYFLISLPLVAYSYRHRFHHGLLFLNHPGVFRVRPGVIKLQQPDDQKPAE